MAAVPPTDIQYAWDRQMPANAQETTMRGVVGGCSSSSRKKLCIGRRRNYSKQSKFSVQSFVASWSATRWCGRRWITRWNTLFLWCVSAGPGKYNIWFYINWWTSFHHSPKGRLEFVCERRDKFLPNLEKIQRKKNERFDKNIKLHSAILSRRNLYYTASIADSVSFNHLFLMEAFMEGRHRLMATRSEIQRPSEKMQIFRRRCCLVRTRDIFIYRLLLV